MTYTKEEMLQVRLDCGREIKIAQARTNTWKLIAIIAIIVSTLQVIASFI